MRKEAARGFRWSGIAAIFVFSIQLLQTGWLARYLTAADFGIMALIYVVHALGQSLSDFGLGNLFVQKQDLSHESKSSIYWLNAALGFTFFLTLYIAAPLFQPLHHSPPFTLCLQWISPVFFINALGGPFQLHFQRLMRFQQIAAAEAAANLAGLLTAIFLASRGHGVFSLAGALLALSTVKSALLAGTHLRHWRPALRFSWSDIREHLRFGGFQMGERIINVFFHSIDKLLVGALLNAHLLGIYSIAYRMTSRPIGLINSVLTRVGFPVFSSLQKDRERTKSTYLQFIRCIAFYSIPLYLGLFAITDDFFVVWLGPGWERAAELFKIMVFLGIFLGLSNPINNVILGKGLVGLSFSLNLLGVAFNALAVLIGSRFGLAGVGWAILLAMGVFMFFLDLVLIWRLEQLSPVDVLRAIFPFALMGGAMTGVLFLCRNFLSLGNPLGNLVLLTGVGILFYGGMILIFQRKFLKELTQFSMA